MPFTFRHDNIKKKEDKYVIQIFILRPIQTSDKRINKS